MRHVALIGVAITCLCSAARADHPTGGIVGGAAGPINAVPAGTLPEGMWAMSLRLEMIDLKKRSNAQLLDFSAAGEDTHSIDRIDLVTASVAYGATDGLSVGLSVPWVAQRNLREADGAGGIEDIGDVEGLGDLSLYSQWRFLNEDRPDSSGRLEMALLGGVKLPTGADREHSPEGELLETEHQPSSGSTDPFVGVAATRSYDRAALTADLIYTRATQGDQKTNMGDVLRYDLAWSYRLSEEELKHEEVHEDGSHHVHGTADRQWDVVVELNGTWKEQVTIGGAGDEDTGGNRILLAPGARLSTASHTSWYVSFGLPVYQNLHGEEHKTEGRAVLGMSWTY